MVSALSGSFIAVFLCASGKSVIYPQAAAVIISWNFYLLQNIENEIFKFEEQICDFEEDLSNEANDIPDDIRDSILAAIGKAKLLMSQKLAQFRGLCDKNIVSWFFCCSKFIWCHNWLKNESKMSQKWTKIKENVSQRWTEIEPKLSQNWAKIEPKLSPKWAQNESKLNQN